MLTTPAIVQGVAFVGGASLALLVAHLLWGSRERLEARLKSVEGPSLRGLGTRRNVWQRLRARLPGQGLAIAAAAPRAISSLERRLQLAGWHGRQAVLAFQTAQAGLFLLALVAAAAAWRFATVDQLNAVLCALGGACLAVLLPGWCCDRWTARRQRVLVNSLPDYLDLMVTCLESGLSLDAATLRVTEELQIAHPLLGREMQQMQREINLGGTPDSALRRLAERSGVPLVAGLATAVQQSVRFGTSLAEALRTQADMLRYEREQRAEERAQRAAVKILIPTLLLIFPAVFVVLAGPAAIQLAETFRHDRPVVKTPARK